MSNRQNFRWRTVMEIGVISAIIYIFLGAPGFPASVKLGNALDSEIPTARAKVENLVYSSSELQCPGHQFDIKIFSTTPLIVVIDGFLSAGEAHHLVNIRFDIPNSGLLPTVADSTCFSQRRQVASINCIQQWS